MPEAIQPDPFAYATYNDFFTRKLKPECRPIDGNINAIVSPADGLIAQIGHIEQNRIIQAKGRYYSVQELLANDNSAGQFLNGSFSTIYLAPKDYHRIHMPFSGRLRKMIYIPGKLFSVNTHAAENIPNVFARNERLVALYDTQVGPMAVIMVGAMIVGGMETVWAGKITPPHGHRIQIHSYDLHAPIELAKGAEMGLFKLGSTVIILFAPQAISWDQDCASNMDVKYGRRIGLVNSLKME